MATLNDSAYRYYNGEPSPAFKSGKTFRTFLELAVPSNGVQVIKIVLPVPVYFRKFDIAVDASTIKIETVVGGTEGGSYSTILPGIKLNLTQPTAYAPQTVLSTGGTLTGGSVIDIVRQKTDGNATRGSSIIQNDESVRGIAAGTYYWRISNLTTDVATGTIKAEWEEL